MVLSEDAVQLLGCCSLNYYLCGVVLAVVGTSEQNADPAQPLLRNIPVSINEVTPKECHLQVTSRSHALLSSNLCVREGASLASSYLNSGRLAASFCQHHVTLQIIARHITGRDTCNGCCLLSCMEKSPP